MCKLSFFDKLISVVIILLIVFSFLTLAGCSSRLSGKYKSEITGNIFEFKGSSIVYFYTFTGEDCAGTYKKAKGGYELNFFGGLALYYAEKKGNSLIINEEKFVKLKK